MEGHCGSNARWKFSGGRGISRNRSIFNRSNKKLVEINLVVMKIEITKIDVKAVDERGALHYFSTDRSGEFLLVYRNKGSISGQHYHKGGSANKNPEDMLLVQGSLILHWKEMEGFKNNGIENAELESGEVEVIAPARVLIPAGIWHQVTAQTDIVFIELNSLADGSEDTYRL